MNVIPGVFFARDGAKPADHSKPAPAETEVATPPPAETEVATPPEVTSFQNICLLGKPLPTRWWSLLTRSTHHYIGEISVGADTVTFRSWTKTLEVRLSDIVRLGARQDLRGPLPLALQYRTADGGSDEVWLGHGWSPHQSRQLHDAIAARLAACR